MSSSWDGLVVFVGGECWDGVRGSHRQLAEALARHRPVLYVDNPMSFVSRRTDATGARLRPGWRIERPGLAVLVPAAAPGLSRPGVRATTAPLVRRAVRRTVAALGSPTVDAVIAASLDDVLTCCPAPTRIVYATDDFVAGADLMRLDRRFLERAERRQAGRADRIVVVSDELAARWRRLGHDPVVVPNGADPALFAGFAPGGPGVSPAPGIDLAPPIAGVVGRISARLDLDVLEAIADTGRSLLLVGPRDPSFAPSRVDALLARPNVAATGAVAFTDLPAHLAAIHTGLTPYTDTAFNRASFPLKTLEYLAAGRDVVATDLPAHRWLATDLVTLETEPRAFAAAVDASLARTPSPVEVERRIALARTHSWDRRATDVLALIDDGRNP